MTGIENYQTQDEAYAVALPASRDRGYVYMIQWPDGQWTVEPNKPSFRSPEMQVIEVRAGQGLFCA